MRASAQENEENSAITIQTERGAKSNYNEPGDQGAAHAHLGRERDLGSLEGVVAGGLDADGEDSAVVGASLGADDDDLPAEAARRVGAGDAPLRRVGPEPLELPLEPRRPGARLVWPRAGDGEPSRREPWWPPLPLAAELVSGDAARSGTRRVEMIRWKVVTSTNRDQ